MSTDAGATAKPRERIRNASGPDRLLYAAIDLFDRKGYAATSVREIVAAAGVTRPVLYYHFGSKEGIFLAIMRRAADRLSRSLGARSGEADGARARGHALGQRIFALVRDHAAVLRLVRSGWNGPPQGTPAFDAQGLHRAVYEAVERVVKDGVRAGELREGRVEEMALALLGAMSVCIEMNLAEAEPRVGAQVLDRVLDVVFEGIASRGKERGP